MHWNILLIVGLVLLIVLAVVFGPLLAIWSINTIFGLSVPYTMKTWAAALFLSGMVSGYRYQSCNRV